jgi:hypothetical protein
MRALVGPHSLCPEAGGPAPQRFRRILVRMAFDEIEDRLQLEKTRAFDLAGFTNGNASNAVVLRQLVEFASGKAGVVIRFALGRSNPNRQSSIVTLSN